MKQFLTNKLQQINIKKKHTKTMKHIAKIKSTTRIKLGFQKISHFGRERERENESDRASVDDEL